MTEPIEVMVKRFRCPFCHHSRSTRGWALKHMARCWKNPDVHGCKTCRGFGHFDRDNCEQGVDLSKPHECGWCEGTGRGPGFSDACRHCNGLGYIPEGPIVHCPKWAPIPSNDNEKD